MRFISSRDFRLYGHDYNTTSVLLTAFITELLWKPQTVLQQITLHLIKNLIGLKATIQLSKLDPKGFVLLWSVKFNTPVPSSCDATTALLPVARLCGLRLSRPGAVPWIRTINLPLKHRFPSDSFWWMQTAVHLNSRLSCTSISCGNVAAQLQRERRAPASDAFKHSRNRELQLENHSTVKSGNNTGTLYFTTPSCKSNKSTWLPESWCVSNVLMSHIFFARVGVVLLTMCTFCAHTKLWGEEVFCHFYRSEQLYVLPY